MVKLATQLIERQTGKYDPADVEDRYEARLREVIDAKLKGEGVEPLEEDEPDRGNVIDLMGALAAQPGAGRRGPGKKGAAPKKAAPKKAPAKKEIRPPAPGSAPKSSTRPALQPHMRPSSKQISQWTYRHRRDAPPPYL